MKLPSFDLSIQDFLAYFIPGTIMLLALMVLLLLTPLNAWIVLIPHTFVSGFIGFVVAYFLGVMVSSFTFALEEKIYKDNKDNVHENEEEKVNKRKWWALKDPRVDLAQLGDFRCAVEKVFGDIAGREVTEQQPWRKEHFYVCKAIVREMSPQTVAVTDRQNYLRQLRRNSFFPLLFWVAAGVLWGIAICLSKVDQVHQHWGVILIIVSGFFFFVAVPWHVMNGLHRSREREVRDICFGLLAVERLREHRRRDRLGVERQH